MRGPELMSSEKGSVKKSKRGRKRGRSIVLAKRGRVLAKRGRSIVLASSSFKGVCDTEVTGFQSGRYFCLESVQAVDLVPAFLPPMAQECATQV